MEKIFVHRSKHLHGVEFIHIIDTQRPWTWFHDTYDISANVGADFDWIYKGRVHSMQGTAVGFAQPGQIHRNTDVRQAQSVFALMCDPKLIRKAVASLGFRGEVHFRYPVVDDPDLFSAIVALGAAVQSSTSQNEVMNAFDQMLERMLVHCESELQHKGTIPPGIAVALEGLNTHTGESIPLNHLADMSGFSRFHFAHLFRRCIGVSPHQYQIAIRISRARQLLRNGHSSTDVADMTGFVDQTHFIRFFHRHMGMTPSQYARGGGPY